MTCRQPIPERNEPMNDQLMMESGKSGGAVECLGMTFPSEDARRAHFLRLLAEKLKGSGVPETGRLSARVR